MRKFAASLALTGLLLITFSASRHQAEAQPRTQSMLAAAPAPVAAGAGIAAVMGLVGAPVDSVFALRGGGTSDFWHYSISQNEWTILPAAPALVGDGGGLVEVASSAACPSGHFYVAALRGASTTDFWSFNIDENRWCVEASTPAPVGAGGAIAQLQRLGKIYVLRGNGTTDFWSFDRGQWKALAAAPGPVSAGGALVGINYGTHSQRDVLYALQGGGSTAVWKYDVATDAWTHQSDVPFAVGAGGAITSPNRGDEGTLNVLPGGGATAVWSLDIATSAWTLIDDTPNAVVAGGATSSQFNGCDFAFIGGGSTAFFATGASPCVAAAPAFSLAFDPPTVTASAGRKLKVKLQIIRSNSFTGSVKVQFAGDLPQGIKLPDEIGSVMSDSVSFKIKLKGGVTAGTHTLTFIGTDDAGRKRTTTLTLIIE